jgi:hypothetical protein
VYARCFAGARDDTTKEIAFDRLVCGWGGYALGSTCKMHKYCCWYQIHTSALMATGLATSSTGFLTPTDAMARVSCTDEHGRHTPASIAIHIRWCRSRCSDGAKFLTQHLLLVLDARCLYLDRQHLSLDGWQFAYSSVRSMFQFARELDNLINWT